MSNNWTTIPSEAVIQQTVDSLEKNGFKTIVAVNGQEAKKIIFDMIPQGSEVLANTSITLQQTGILDEIDNSGKFTSVRKKIFSLDRQQDADEIRKLRSSPFIALGSVHAVTHAGQLVIASNSGSQLSNEVYGAKEVIFVVGAQKIVTDTSEGEKRIFEYSLPLETPRARKQYNLPQTWHSYPSKILIYNKEPVPNRVKVILVKEVLGF